MRVLISAGEASGEFYGAKLIEALRQELSRRKPDAVVQAFGIGGEQMRLAGCELLVDAGEIAEVGIVEVVKHIPNIYRRFRQVVREAEQRRPDVAVLIDFPEFNLRMAKQLHRLRVPVVYYVSPQLWAWKQWRIEIVRKYVDRMLVIFPFEKTFYRDRGIAATFVGHPLADLPEPTITREQFAAEHKLDLTRPWIALLPGSRRGEVTRIFPTLVETAQLLGRDYVYLVPVASTLEQSVFLPMLTGYSGPSIVFTREARSTLLHARAAAVASGTATVEAALIGTPFVMVYRVAALSWAVGRRLVNTERFAMVNLIAGRDVVPELVQSDFTADRLSIELRRIIADGPPREMMLEGIRQVRKELQAGFQGGDASKRAAQAVLSAAGCGT